MKLMRSKLFWFAVLLVLICLTMMIYSAATGKRTFLTDVTAAVVTPLQNGVSKGADKVSDLFGYFYRYSALQRENEELKQELDKYKALENQYYEAVSQNGALREAAGIKAKRAEFELEVCSVVSVAGSGFQSALTLSRGSLSGIEEGDPVITGKGLVGYVSEVGLTSCTVTTVINTNFTASAVISRSREVVSVQGNFELAADGLLKIPYLEETTNLHEGDAVVTSGGNYPPDLIVGYVTEVQPERHGISWYAAVRPAVKAEGLSTVFVIKSFEVED